MKIIAVDSMLSVDDGQSVMLYDDVETTRFMEVGTVNKVRGKLTET